MSGGGEGVADEKGGHWRRCDVVNGEASVPYASWWRSVERGSQGAAYGMWRQGAGDATVNNGFARLAAGAARKGCNFAKFILSTNARKNERALEKMLGRHL